MAEVFLDGEKVDFEGTEPSSANELWNLVESFLGQQGRVLTQLTLDGEAWRLGDADRSFAKAEFSSESQGQQVEALLASVLEKADAVGACLEAFSGACLARPWRETQKAAPDLLEVLKPSLEVLGLVGVYGANFNRDWAAHAGARIERLNTEVGELLDAVEAGDAIRTSDASALGVRSAYADLASYLAAEVKGKVEAD